MALDLPPAANALRGEADLSIGGVPLVIAVEFAALAKLSRMIRAETMDEIYRRLLGFEPFAVSCALLALAVDPEGPAKAQERAMKAAAVLSAADETAWRAAFEEALAAHVDKGRAARGELTNAELAARALRAADAELAGDDPRKKGASPS